MDDLGRTPLMLAAQAPFYKVPNLSDEGFTVLEDVVYGNESEDESDEFVEVDAIAEYEENSGLAAHSAGQPSPTVVSIVLQASLANGFFSALWPDKSGQLPLHAAVAAGKKWDEGVKNLVDAYSDALTVPHPASGLYPFMIAAQHDDLETIYQVLRSAPSLMSDIIDTKNDDKSDSRSETATDSTASETSSEDGQ
jgi:ankyrin repeat protein